MIIIIISYLKSYICVQVFVSDRNMWQIELLIWNNNTWN